ncbi:MAG: alpha/beta hydrolase family protein [Mycobacteriaceae bacterium]|uniref:alpha/beta hydrolase family protein n=1 Tax=Corynebacterium sp. TaxID=1720 RepID=UPI003F975D7A
MRTRPAPSRPARVAVAAVLAVSMAAVTAATTSAQPVVPGSPMPDPVPNMTAPNWSGLDVRDPLSLTGDLALPDAAGVAMHEVPLDEPMHMPDASAHQRFVYSTIDQHGDIAASTAAVYLPKGATPEGGWPVVAWAHGTVGVGDDCTPSAGHRNDADYLNHWLTRGYAVVAADYTGLGTPGLMSYFNGETTATSVVDAVVAAHGLDSTADQLADRWAVVGQSQGGGAALHIAHGAAGRSGESGLDYRGAVATGAPAYIEELALASGPTFPPAPLGGSINAYLAYTLAGFREAHPGIDVDSALTDEGRRIADAAETSCLRELRQALNPVNIASAFSRPLSDVPGLEAALRSYMATPTDGYDRPVFLGHGLLDLDVPGPIGMVLNSEMWIRQFTGSNEQVEVHWYPENHGDTLWAALKHSEPFLRRILA